MNITSKPVDLLFLASWQQVTPADISAILGDFYLAVYLSSSSRPMYTAFRCSVNTRFRLKWFKNLLRSMLSGILTNYWRHRTVFHNNSLALHFSLSNTSRSSLVKKIFSLYSFLVGQKQTCWFFNLITISFLFIYPPPFVTIFGELLVLASWFLGNLSVC